jgi:peptide/nickel transport system permease protein
MEPLTWSGALGPILNPIMLAAIVVFALGFVTNFILVLVGVRAGEVQINPDHTLTIDRTPVDYALMAMKYAALLFVACCAGLHRRRHGACRRWRPRASSGAWPPV